MSGETNWGDGIVIALWCVLQINVVMGEEGIKGTIYAT